VTKLNGCSANEPEKKDALDETELGEPATSALATCSFQSRMTEALLYPCSSGVRAACGSERQTNLARR